KTIKTFEYAVNLYPDVVTMRFVPATNYFEGGKGFVKILFEDKIVVFEKIEAQLITNTPSYGTSGAVTKAVQNIKNFIVLPDTQKPIQFKRTNANLSKAIGKEDLKDYLKSKKLDISENKDLAMAMGYLKTFYK
ncbi:MAG: hypothetical protein O9262_07430, partial [Cyclobacteriaceae bacterium]|nr:hypothetical protein [Cyclobacteriaceae bacterium]